MNFDSKKEMAIFLANGGVLDAGGSLITFDETRSPPFRFGDDILNGLWNSYASNSWTVVKEWWEEIPSQGILCKVWDSYPDDKFIALVTDYLKEDADNYPFKTEKSVYRHAKPMTKEEIESFTAY